MRYRIMPRILGLAIILGLLLTVMQAAPALAAPQISLSPASGARGTEVTVTGTNFASYAGDVIRIMFGGVEIADSPLIVPQDGTFVVAFDVPRNAVPGRAYVIVNDARGSQLARSGAFTIVGTDVKIDPEVGTVGTEVTVSGTGVYASSKVTFYYYSSDARVKMGVEVASPTGEFTYSFAIPESASGSHGIVVRDADDNETEVYFDVLPSIGLEPVSAPIGADLAVSGTGFSYESYITIYLGDTPVAIEITDKYGSFEVNFNVPAMKPDTYDVRIRDEAGNSDEAEFTIIHTSANLSSTTGYIGTELTVTGSGYIADRTVTIKYDTTQVATTTVNTKGTFSVIFKVPASQYGDHIVTVSDGTITRQFTFTVESEAPPIPQLLLPPKGNKVESPVYFDWDDVTDESSPVTYTLQIATSKDFETTSIVLEKRGLTSSDYLIAEDEKLEPVKRKDSYYWRVKAIDGASNESKWSTGQSFYTTGLPNWLRYTIIAIVWVITGFICFRIGRRR